MLRIPIKTKSSSFVFCCILLALQTMILSTKAYDNVSKCLTNYPDVFPRVFPYYLKSKIYITIDVSPRITHQLSTHLFKIFLEEVLGYERIKINEYDDHFQLPEAIDRLSGTGTDNFPKALINLELWVTPDQDTVEIENSRFVKDNGNSLPPGRFGWFIPFEFSNHISEFTKQLYTNDSREIHWAHLRDKKFVSTFDINNDEHLNIIKNNTYELVDSKINYYCTDANCVNGIYTPPQCKHSSCAFLLTSEFVETNFVIDHINELQLYVKVVWLGKNLKKVYDELMEHYTKSSSHYRNKSLIVLHYCPSKLFRQQQHLIRVVFKACQLLKSTESMGCKYEMNRLAKFSWNKLDDLGAPLQTAVRNFKLQPDEYEKLLTIYEDNRERMSYRDMACMWMVANENSWRMWKHGSNRKLYIGGIFPITGSTYHGAGIIRGALMAKDIINQHADILPGHQLNIAVSDGQCKADSVMKSFIDYVVDSYYSRLLGILGPACSETVEPLAGVSKHFKIMVISYSAEGASYSDKDKYPYFFRTIGENNHYMHVYLNFFERMGWKRIAALTEDGQRYTEYISGMQNFLAEHQITLISNAKFPREKKNYVMRKYLEDLKEKRARIIIVDVFDHFARTVMCEAYKLSMTPFHGCVSEPEDYRNFGGFADVSSVMIKADSIRAMLLSILKVTLDIDEYLDILKSNHQYNNFDNNIEVANGYFSLAHEYYAPDDTVIIGNMTVAEWKEMYERRSHNVAKEGTSNYAGFAYDAIWVYALAVDKLMRINPEALSDLHSDKTTEQLVRLVENTDFIGVSGRIKFHGGPSRFSTMNLMQWYNNRTHIIGQFTPNVSNDKPVILGGKLFLNESRLSWFTGDGQKPEDGTLPPESCSLSGIAHFFNVNCDAAFWIVDGFAGVVICICLTMFTLMTKRQYKTKMDKTHRYLKSLGLHPDGPFGDSRWEISRDKVVINRKLGEGAFGTVFGGEAELPNLGWVAVAVKTLKPGSSCEDKLNFLSEVEVMKRFTHQNIVKLHGVCTQQEPIYTIMEFMLYGDLKTYLLDRRCFLKYGVSPDSYQEISSQRLTSMALDVARALEYLAKHNFVHRDIACRNCLVSADRTVKLGDFGMTRQISDNNYYKFVRKGMLPVRWMAPESLTDGKFSLASDIWSYGVLIHEIVTLGNFPHQNLDNNQVVEFIKGGGTLRIFKEFEKELKDLLDKCWKACPDERPTATEIVRILDTYPTMLMPYLEPNGTQMGNSDKYEIKFGKVKPPNVNGSGGGGGGVPVPNGCVAGNFRTLPSVGTELSLLEASTMPLLYESAPGPSRHSKHNGNDEEEEEEEEDDFFSHTYADSKV